jgi:hypothetical protein
VRCRTQRGAPPGALSAHRPRTASTRESIAAFARRSTMLLVPFSRSSSATTTTVTALRALIAQRHAAPSASSPADSVLPSGLPQLDRTLGGLPPATLTEIVCDAPSCGGHLVLAGLLAATRQARQRIALVDVSDAFDPGSHEPSSLEHLVWVRPRTPEEGFAAADLLARDANLAWVVLELRGVPAHRLNRIPAPSWYRLQRALESSGVAGLVLSPHPLAPCARVRLRLRQSHCLLSLDEDQSTLIAGLEPAVERHRPTSVRVAGA